MYLNPDTFTLGVWDCGKVVPLRYAEPQAGPEHCDIDGEDDDDDDDDNDSDDDEVNDDESGPIDISFVKLFAILKIVVRINGFLYSGLGF